MPCPTSVGATGTCSSLLRATQPAMATTDTRVRAHVLGVDIDRLDMRQTVERCREIIESGQTAQHVSINVAKLVALHEDPRLRAIVERCEIISADGQPIVWAS